MNGLIWMAAAIFILQLVHGGTKSAINTNTPESNPYKKALLARPWESVQDYVTVRPGEHMFFWLFYADGTMVDAYSKPLIIWLQGGPSFPASGIGNFAEIGPLTMDITPRNHTWVKGRNVLLFDFPVGAGFSFVRNNSLLNKTDQDVATDLFEAVKEFFRIHKDFTNTPTYLFGQGYGGKLCPRLAYNLHTGIEEGKLKMNLKGIGIGSAFVDSRESITMIPGFLYHLGLIPQNVYVETAFTAKVMRYFIKAGDYKTGMFLFGNITSTLRSELPQSVNYYNINQPKINAALYLLQRKMNVYVKPTLLHTVNQDLEWKYASNDVMTSLYEGYLEPSTKFVEMLLNDTKLKVAVYNGILDLTPLAGTSNWVRNLKWSGSAKFKSAKPHEIRGTNNGFYKVANQLSLWSVFKAGHFVPEDNPVAMEHILEYVMSDEV